MSTTSYYPSTNTMSTTRSCIDATSTTNYVFRTPHDCRSRDIKRRLEVIQKKMADLQELGVPCAFCYISIRNSGTLFTMGNSAITQVIEHSRDVIFQQLSKNQNGTSSDQESPQWERKEIHMLLPPLPAPLEDLSLQDLRGLVVGIIKDLGLKWSDPKPLFWPQEIPFQYPRNAPDGFQGNKIFIIVV